MSVLFSFTAVRHLVHFSIYCYLNCCGSVSVQGHCWWRVDLMDPSLILTLQPVIQMNIVVLFWFWEESPILHWPSLELIFALTASLLFWKIAFHRFHKLCSAGLYSCHWILFAACFLQTDVVTGHHFRHISIIKMSFKPMCVHWRTGLFRTYILSDTVTAAAPRWI